MFADPEVLPLVLAICVAAVVLGRAIQPLLGSMGALAGLIGTAVALIAAIAALCALILAGVADWPGWNQGSAPGPGRAQPLLLAMPAIGAAVVGTLIVVALFLRRLRRRKRPESGPFWRD